MGSGRMSRGDVLLLAAVLAAAGAADAAYLTWEWYAASASWCDVNAYLSCSAVRASVYASIGGVPTATIGLAGFLLLTAIAASALRGRERLLGRPIDSALLGLAVLGALIGAGLSVLEVFVIRAVCILCVLGFALDLGILGLGLVLVRRAAIIAAAPE